MLSTTFLVSVSTIFINLILPSLSGGCRYVAYGTGRSGPVLVDNSICPSVSIAFADVWIDFRCEEPSPGADLEPLENAYSNGQCSSLLGGGPVVGDCSLPETGCNVYRITETLWAGDDGCGVIDPDDDCIPTCDIGFPTIIGDIVTLITDGGANECVQVTASGSVLYSDISEQGYNVQSFNNIDCSGTPVETVEYFNGCRRDGSSDSRDISIELIDAAETTTSLSPTEEPTEEPNCIWSEWYDRDDPTFTGDWETIDTFAGDGTLICNGVTPIDIDCESLSGIDYDDFVFSNAVQSTTCDASFGFQCLNSQSQSSYPTDCPDFRVRFCCGTN